MKNTEYLNRWESYRENKICMVSEYLQVHKSQKRIQNWLIVFKTHQIFKKVQSVMDSHYAETKKKFNEILTGIMVRVRFRKRFILSRGEDYLFRERNRMRHGFVGYAELFIKLQYQRMLEIVKKFLVAKLLIKGKIYKLK